MWDRPNDHVLEEPIEINMFVVAPQQRAVVRESFDGSPDDIDIDIDQDAPSVDPVLLLRQGTGTWPNGERAVRLGNAEEILITLPTNPFAAMDAARSAMLDMAEIPRLRIDRDSQRSGEFEVQWSAALRAPIRWRKVSLRLYASPSLNVTVMTIVPVKARKISSHWFVRNGLRTAREFGRRVTAEAERGSVTSAS